jgi:hypothetical protein
MALHTAAAFLAAKSGRKPVSFMVEALGQEVLLRSPTISDLGEYLEFCQKHSGSGGKELVPKMLQMFLCDADGKRLFAEDQAAELADVDARAAMQICKKCQELLAIDEPQIERMEGNSAASR